MTLTVRLDGALGSALERYCAERSVSKSLVVQESLAVYLAAAQAHSAPERAATVAQSQASVNYRAFANAGFVGTSALGGTTADKAAVRLKAAQRILRSRQ